MSPSPRGAEARAARLVRWYPKEWRARYGDEFADLLAADITERPRSCARYPDVAVGALMARLAALGLSGSTVDPSDQPRRSLATFSGAVAVFLTVALSLWTHLAIAWRHAAPDTAATHAAMTVMTAAVVVSVAATVVGATPIAWLALRTARCAPHARLRPPLLLALGGLTVLVAGAVAFHHGWTVSGGSPWTQQSAGPGGLPAVLWTATLAVSSYWAHPAVLLRLPATEAAWMAISPAALVAVGAGAAGTIRRLPLSTRLARFTTRTGRLALVGLGLWLFGTLVWLVDGSSRPAHLFQAGTVDQVGGAVMAATLLVAVHALQRARGPLQTLG